MLPAGPRYLKITNWGDHCITANLTYNLHTASTKRKSNSKVYFKALWHIQSAKCSVKNIYVLICFYLWPWRKSCLHAHKARTRQKSCCTRKWYLDVTSEAPFKVRFELILKENIEKLSSYYHLITSLIAVPHNAAYAGYM